MTEEAKQLIEKARQLSATEREEVLEGILSSLVQDNPSEADQAWRDMIDQRLAEIEAGGVAWVDFDAAVAALRRK